MNLEIIPARNNPKTEGRYLCFVSHDVKAEIAKPIVLLWWKGGWHFDESNVRFPRPPYGYAGPLPTGKLADLFPQCVSETHFTGKVPDDDAIDEAADKLRAHPEWKHPNSEEQEYDL